LKNKKELSGNNLKYTSMKTRQKKLKAFTLIELLTVLMIVGGLVAMAVVNLMPIVSKAKSTEAQLQLEHVFTLEKSFFYMHSKYSADLKDISYEPAKLVTEDGNANYRLEITQASNAGFKAIATSVTDFDGDGVFNVWEIDHDKHIKEVTPD
jgi:type IV pilus assembly protein PilE